MPLLDGPVPIETGDHILRARRTAAVTRIAVGLSGFVLLLARPHLLPHAMLGLIGFATIQLTAIVQLAAPRLSWLTLEESISASAGVLIIGFGSERVSVLSVLWLVAIGSGVLARGGRAHWIGRNIVLGALLLPVVRYGYLSGEYAALLAATMGLLLTSGRTTAELNRLLAQARLQAENAETLLLAGDIAARMDGRGVGEAHADGLVGALGDSSSTLHERRVLARLIEGDGVWMAVQPIVDIQAGTIHAYEALVRFDEPLRDGSPLHWLSLAQELGERAALERTCLRLALELFAKRPPGTGLSVNLSAPVLLEAPTMNMLEEAAGGLPHGLSGLIIEITEETLVQSDVELHTAIAPLRARGVQLAVDDMGAGYSGLRQITTVQPRYLKLDRSLVSGVDMDAERAALMGALAGYSRQVGSMLLAEGVETEAELNTIRGLGVPLVQGFYMARPGRPWPEVAARASGPVAEALAPDRREASRARPAADADAVEVLQTVI